MVQFIDVLIIPYYGRIRSYDSQKVYRVFSPWASANPKDGPVSNCLSLNLSIFAHHNLTHEYMRAYTTEYSAMEKFSLRQSKKKNRFYRY